MAYGARLESVLGESPRGFESPILRHQREGPDRVSRSGPLFASRLLRPDALGDGQHPNREASSSCTYQFSTAAVKLTSRHGDRRMGRFRNRSLDPAPASWGEHDPHIACNRRSSSKGRYVNVIVVGGGMAGVACAAELGERRRGDLVDRHDYTQFQPLLYQVATSQLPAEDIARPLATVFRDGPRSTVVDRRGHRNRPATRAVTTNAGELGPADHLVIAAGSQPNFFGSPARPSTRSRCTRWRTRSAAAAPAGPAAVLCDPAGRPGAFNVVICGGGPTGVEIAGASRNCSRAARRTGGSATGRRPPRRPRTRRARAVHRRSHAYALEKLTEMGVQVTFGVAVAAVGPDM